MMCGEQAVDPAVLDRLTKALAHRGPDGSGSYVDSGVAILNTRLAIIDLENGAQPFVNTDGSALVANGEIYNDPDIRASLPDAPFRSRSDCEPPLYLYREKGLDFVDELRGMYGIAIYDKPKRELVLTRDPFGIKQLYYVSTPDYFAFASEAQALIAAGLADNSTNTEKCVELLQLKFTTGRDTVFAQINRLLPGETIVVADGKIIERRRRNVLPHKKAQTPDVRTALTRLDQILEDSVAAHIRSDVPYGLFLSGGIDSSALLSLVARISPQPVSAFTAAFPNSRAADESRAAARAARATGARHEIIELTAETFWNTAPQVAAAMDDPTTDAAALPTFMLARAARKAGIKVVLSGDGADELFGGYSRHRRAVWLFGLLGHTSRTRGNLDDLIAGTALPAFANWRSGFESVERESVRADWSTVQNIQAIDCAAYLPNHLLVKLDRCLMAHGVEGRTPFLDPIVGPYGFELPAGLKVRGQFGKWLLRKWLSENLPEAGAFEKKKGFNPPFAEWIEFYKDDLMPLLSAQPGIVELSLSEAAKNALMDTPNKAQAASNLLFYGLWHSYHVLGIPAEGSIGDVLAAAAKM